jgi:exonuclease SbcC
LLVNMLAEIEYDLVIEFGSGTSTALIAKSLAVINPRRQAKGNEPVLQLSFEHLREYYERTSNSLRQAGLEHAVELVHAPLAPLVLNGLTYQYYECQATIEKARLGLLDGKPRVLVLVDGPPASTGRHARYPGTPIVLEIFSDAEVDVILDDYNRTDEKEIVNMWASDCKAFGLNCVIREIALDKGACFVEIRSDKANTENTD